MAATLPPEAGPSRTPLGQSERSARGAKHEPGIVIPEKNCAQCIARQTLCLWKPARRAQSCQLCWQLKKPCRRFEETVVEGKRKVEDERGTRKRPRVAVEEMGVRAEESERVERSQKEDSRLLLGAEVARAIWQLGDRLSSVTEELAASQEAAVEESRLLHRVLVRNLRQIEMAFEGQGGREEEGESEVEGAEAVEESGRWVEERAE